MSAGCRDRARRIRRSTTSWRCSSRRVDQPLTVLPTHRILRGLGEGGVAGLNGRLDELFEVRRGVEAAELRRVFEAIALSPGGAGRFGLWTRSGGMLLTARASRV